MSLMGVDVGTTGVKAVVFSENGSLLSSAYEEYPLRFPFPGASELDSNAVIRSALEVIAKAADLVKSDDPVRTIGIASQGEAFTPITRDGEMLANAMTSSDARAQPFVERWLHEFGRQAIYGITGHTPYPMYSLFKLLWLKENRPDVWEEAWKFLFFQDLLAYSLTGATRTDYTMAARTMLFDVRHMDWSNEILARIALPVERLPEVVSPGSQVGTVRQEMASALGLKSPTWVSVCGHDQPVGGFGCGAASPGKAAYSIGTVECVCPAIDRLILNEVLMEANLASYPHVLPDTYTTVAFNMTGGIVLRWLRDNILPEQADAACQANQDAYDRIISCASPEPARLILLPHFGPTGTPHFDSYGTGVLFGMDLSTTRPEIIRAFLEGITYEMKWNLSVLGEAGIRLTELRAIGGGTKSNFWMQIKADLLGVPLTTMRVTESTCMGAAILAGAGAGIIEADEAALSWAQPIRTFEPRDTYRRQYDERFEIYREIYGSLRRARSLLRFLDSQTESDEGLASKFS